MTLKSTQGATNNTITSSHLPEHTHTGTAASTTNTHTHNVVAANNTTNYPGSPDPGFFAGGIATGQTIATSAANDTHSHTLTINNGGGVTSPTEYTPLHYVINYIIYKGPLGA